MFHGSDLKKRKIPGNGKDLLILYTDQPKDSDDQTSAHSCYRLSNEKRVEVDTKGMYHRTSLLPSSH